MIGAEVPTFFASSSCDHLSCLRSRDCDGGNQIETNYRSEADIEDFKDGNVSGDHEINGKISYSK